MKIGAHTISIIRLLSFLCLLGCFTLPAYGDITPNSEEAVQTAKSLLSLPDLTLNEYKHEFTHDQKALHAILQGNSDLARAIISDESNDLPHKHLFLALMDIEENKPAILNEYSAFRLLKTSVDSVEWKEKHIANLLVALVYIKRNNAFESLKYAHDSLSTIPKLSNKTTQTARYDSYYLIHITYALDSNPRATLNAVKKLSEIMQDTAIPYGKFTVLYNLGTSFEKISDYSTALIISEMLLKKSKSLSVENQFISNLFYGRNLTKLSRYQEAVSYIQTALKLAPNERYEVYLRALLIESLAYLNDFERAEKEISIIENQGIYQSEQGTISREIVMKAKTFIFAGSGDFEQAYNHNRIYSDNKIEELTQALSNDRREVHRRVLLNQELAEKDLEKAELQLELDQARLARQKFLNNVYLGLIILGGLIALATIAMARKLSLLNEKLKFANEQVTEKAKVKSQLLAMFSHEMLTPLNGIIPLADVLQHSESDEKKRRLLKMIELNGSELTRKIKEIILISNSDDQTNDPLDVNVKKFLHECHANYRDEVPDNVEFNVRISPAMPKSLYLDLARLEHSVEALLSNSFKYTKRGEVRLSFYMNENKAPVLEITDTGSGMPSQHLNEMIKPFGQASLSMSRDNQGLGLGLTIVRLHCEIMQADFNIESEPDVGTVVKITFNKSKDGHESQHLDDTQPKAA